MLAALAPNYDLNEIESVTKFKLSTTIRDVTYNEFKKEHTTIPAESKLFNRENDMKSSRTLFFGGWSNNGGKLAWNPNVSTGKQISTDSSMYFYKLQKLLHSVVKCTAGIWDTEMKAVITKNLDNAIYGVTRIMTEVEKDMNVAESYGEGPKDDTSMFTSDKDDDRTRTAYSTGLCFSSYEQYGNQIHG